MRKSYYENGIVYTNVALVDTKLEELEIDQEIEWYPCSFESNSVEYLRQYIDDDRILGTAVYLKSGNQIPTSLDYDEFEKIRQELRSHYQLDLKNNKPRTINEVKYVTRGINEEE